MRFLSTLILSFLVAAPVTFAASGDFTPNNDSSRRTNGLVYELATPAELAGLLSGGAPADAPNGTGTDIEFNLFRDDTFYAQLKRHIPLGLNREASIQYVDTNGVDATHMDERDFLSARNVLIDLGLDEDEKYEHSLTGLDVNDEIKVMLYVHNNGEHKCTSNPPLNTATNTTVSLDWSDKPTTTSMNLVGNINADNEDMTAATGINDTVDLAFASGDHTLQINTITVLSRIDPDGTPTGNECGSTNQGWQTVDAIGAGDVTSTATSAEVDLGDLDGSYANVHVVIFRMEIVPISREFSISKSATPDPLTNTVAPGDPITFTIDVENLGGAAITNLEVTDTINSFFTFVSGPAGTNESADPLFDAGALPNLLLDFDTLAIGATESLSFDVTVTTGGGAPPSGTQVCNSASGTGDTLGTFTSNDECYIVQVNPNCGNDILELDKNEECDDGNTTSQDGCSSTCEVEDSGLTLVKTADVTAGQQIPQDSNLQYQLTFANPGEQVLNNLVITDVVLDGLTVVDVQDSFGDPVAHTAVAQGNDTLVTINVASLAVGASVDYFINTTVDTNASEGTILNQATITAEAEDPFTGTVTLSRTSPTPTGLNHNIPAKCGNSVTETGAFGGTAESCDDGNTTGGDGCDATCQLEALDITLRKFGDDPLSGATVGLGDTIEYRIEVTNNGPSSMDTVVITDVLDSRLNYLLPIGDPEIAHAAGTVTITVAGGLAAAETKTYNFTVQVDAGAAVGELTNVLTVDASGPHPSQTDIDDGPSNQTKHFVVADVTPVCGNGRLEAGSPREECDDGNTTALDGCSDLCLLENPGLCGDTNVDPGEECDDGNRIPGDGCNDFCQDNSDCGNGTLDVGEQGDDGNLVDGDGIDSSCNVEVDGVTMKKTSIPYSGTTLGEGDQITFTFEVHNPEIIAINSVVLTDVLNSELDFVSSASGFAVTDIPTNTVSLNVGTIAAGATETYTFIAEVKAGATPGIVNNVGNLTAIPAGQSDPISVDSNGTVYFVVDNIVRQCGNARLESGEECDDGNSIGGDGCSHVCQFEGTNCPDGDAAGAGQEGEECDDNNDLPGDNCNRLCQNEFDCGNGVVEGSEECDDGNLIDGDSCSPTCVVIAVCGNGITEAPETCDDGNLIAGDGCDGHCQTEPEGGGNAPVRTVVGICDLTPDLTPQCIGKRPERANEYWGFYEDCKDDTEFTEEECALQWAVHEGFQLCGDLAREFVHATPAEAMDKCGYQPPEPLRLSCTPSFCADCIFGTADISIGALDPHEGSPLYKSEGVHIASKEDVDYQVAVDLALKDPENFQIREDIPIRVNIYDYTIPSESAHVWYREGIVNEDTCEESQYGRECWVVRDAVAGGKIFTRALTREEIQLINAGAVQSVKFDYEMKSDFLFEETYAEQLSNVVFATLEFGYDYYDAALEVWSAETDAVYGIGGDVCSEPVYFGDLLGSESTLGARSTITLQRPTLQVHGGESVGSQLLQTSLFGQAAGGVVTPGWGDGDTATSYYRSLIQNSINLSAGVLFDQMIPETETSIYYINSGNVKLIGNIDMRGTSKTFIIEGYNLEVLDDFEVTNGFAGFIVIGGDVVISNHVRNMQGIFIAKGAERNRQMVGGNIRPEHGVGKSSVPLQVSGALIGNLAQLTANRVYIGSYDTEGEFSTQPSIESLFDVRMLEQTPPGLEATRGTDWGQGL